jgi:probable HAF family extracellular repeat protein
MFRFHRLAAAIAALLLASPILPNAASATASNRNHLRDRLMHRGGYAEEGTQLSRDASTRSAPRVAVNPATVPAGYPRYRLIDLGTLGGPESVTVFPGRTLNNRGAIIAQADTAVSDPNCVLSCYFDHALLRRPNGQLVEMPFPAGIDPTVNTSFPGDIAANGQAGGFVTNGLIDPLTGFPQFRPVVWGAFGGVWDLGTFGGNSGGVNMLNSWGHSVGVALNTVPEDPDFASFMNGSPATTQARAFLWNGGKLRDLGTLGGNDAVAFAINGSDTIYGMSYTDTVANDSTGLPTFHPFLWKNGSMQDLGTLGGTEATPGSFNWGPWGPVLNDHGQAIGTSTLAGDETWHAFLWDKNKMIDLGTLGGDNSEALAINERGWVVGRSDYSPDSTNHHAVLWRNGTIQDLGLIAPCLNSSATSVNSRGDVVGGQGHCMGNPGDRGWENGIMWRPGKEIVDLNSLIVPASDMYIDWASGINDKGEIAANAILPTGEFHAVLLVPISQ